MKEDLIRIKTYLKIKLDLDLRIYNTEYDGDYLQGDSVEPHQPGRECTGLCTAAPGMSIIFS
jgi:hypothetical protein